MEKWSSNVSSTKYNKCCSVSCCCKECSENHWEVHNKPYIISHSNTLGRYLKTSRDIKAGEVLHKEIPTAVGPQPGSPITCLGCLQRISITSSSGFYHCSTCYVGPFCNFTCTNNEWHSALECGVLASQKSKCSSLEPIILQPQTVLPLRCFLLQWTKPVQWKALMELEGHHEVRKGTAIWRGVNESVVYVLQATGLITPENHITLQKICSILDVNSFEVRGPEGNPLRAIYPTAALLAHDCLPSTCIAHEICSMALVIRAAFDLKTGDLITHNYAGTLISTIERRENLRKGKYFECICLRCRDPFELGTNLGSLKCSFCYEGPVVSKNPINECSDWRCEKCNHEISGALAAVTHSVAHTKLSENNETDVEAMELFLENLRKSFYPGHAILLEIGQNLAGLYNEHATKWATSFRCTYPLHRRWKLCKELLDALYKLEPGISRLKGLCMYEMAIPAMMLATRGHGTGRLDSKDAILILEQSEKLLQQSIANLLYEPTGSPEQKLVYSALRSLQKVKELIARFSKVH